IKNRNAIRAITNYSIPLLRTIAKLSIEHPCFSSAQPIWVNEVGCIKDTQKLFLHYHKMMGVLFLSLFSYSEHSKHSLRLFDGTRKITIFPCRIWQLSDLVELFFF